MLLAAVHGPVVFGGKTLSPALLQPHGLTDGLPYGYEGRVHAGTFNVDLPTAAWYEWPVNRTVGNIYRNGELPLWNPYQAGGAPLAADYSTRAFFPYQILEDISPPPLSDVFILGRPLLAGLFTYIFLASAGLGFAGALAGAVLYMLSGVFTWFVNLEQMGNVAMALPLVMWASELVATRPGRRAVALMAVAVALVVTGGQPEVALYCLLLSALYLAFRSGAVNRGNPHGTALALAAGLAGLVVGLLLAGPLVLPFIEYVEKGFTLHPVGSGVGEQFVANWKKFFAVLTPGATEMPADPALLPGVLADSRAGFFHRVFATKGSWDFLGGYTGVVGIYLAGCGAALSLSGAGRDGGGAARLITLLFTAFATVVVLKNFGVPPFPWLGKLPLFDRVWSPRWAGPSWVFAVSCAGAGGLELLGRTGPRAGRRASHIPLYVFAALSAFVVLFPLRYAVAAASDATSFGPLSGPFVAPSILMSAAAALVFTSLAFLVARRISGNIWGANASALVALAAAELWWAVPRGYDPAWLHLKLIPLGAALFAVAVLIFGRTRVAMATAVVSFVAFMAVDLTSPRGLPSRHNAFAEPPYVAFLSDRLGLDSEGGVGGYRVMGSYGALVPNYAGSVGLHDLRHISALAVPSFRDLKHSRLRPPVDGEDTGAPSLWFTGLPQRVTVVHDESRGYYYDISKVTPEDVIAEKIDWYSVMGVRYFVMPSGYAADGMAGMSLVYDEEVRIFENPSALPRAFVVYDDSGAVSLGDYIGPGSGAVPARIVEDGANRVVVEARAKRPGDSALLVLSDVYYPGWTVEVDGEPAEMLVVEGALRGVMLSPGHHRVEFVYSPRSFRNGLVLFGAGLVVVAGLVAPVGRFRYNR